MGKATTNSIYTLFRLMGAVPRRWTITVAGIIGDVWYALDRKYRKVMWDNLELAFGSDMGLIERNRISQAVYRNLARIPFEIGWSLNLSAKEQLSHYRVQGMEHFQHAYEKGKGVIILTLHIGNWELLPAVFLSKGIGASIVYRPLAPKALDNFFLSYRSRFGAHPIPKKKSMRKIMKALKRNECVGILLDQDSGLTAGVFADFFGFPACTNKGMALVAMKTGAPVLPAYLVRDGKKFNVHIDPPIPHIETGRKEEDLQKNTANYNKVLEEIVRKYPEQWLWLHKRWKTRPKNSPHDKH